MHTLFAVHAYSSVHVLFFSVIADLELVQTGALILSNRIYIEKRISA